MTIHKHMWSETTSVVECNKVHVLKCSTQVLMYFTRVLSLYAGSLSMQNILQDTTEAETMSQLIILLIGKNN